MKKTSALLVIVSVLLMLSILPSFNIRPVRALTIRVPQDVSTIQDALNMATDGDMIQVSPGTYDGNFSIRVSVSLIGLDTATTIIDGNAASHTIRVSANNVYISGFTIRNADKGVYLRRVSGTVVSNNILTNCNASVYISYGSSNSNITNNTIVNNLDYGIRLYNTTGNTITGNAVSNNPNGISLGSFTSSNTISYNTVFQNQYGIRVYNSTGNAVENNQVADNGYGIYVFTGSASNTIRFNNASANEYGFQLIDSANSLLRGNTFNSNGNNFAVYGENLDDFIQDIDTSNTVDGKPIYYLVNRNNMQVPLNAGYVAVVNSTNVTVKDLTLTRNQHGVLFAYTNNSIIQNVVVQNNTYGIFLRTSTNDILSNNVMTNNTNNFGVYGTALPHFIHGIDASNLAGGKPIYYAINQNGITVPTNAGYVGVINSTNITVQNLTLTNNYQGLLFAYTASSLIQNVSALDNQYGFYFDYATGNVVNGSALKNNSYRGMYLYNSTNNIITNSTFSTNAGIGLKMEWYSTGNTISRNRLLSNELGMWINFSSNNRIYHNDFIMNTVQAMETNGTSIWNDAANTGNYWSDYTGQDLNGDKIGDTLLPHLGLDYYPSMVPYVSPLLIGDVNGDGVVNMRDIGLICNKFGTNTSSLGWDSRMDLNGDGVVNMRDIGIACANFGKKLL